MSTRSAITVPEAGRCVGVYHHWDGYPSGLGQTLLRMYQVTFDGDLAEMKRLLIDAHPAGWSTLNFSYPYDREAHSYVQAAEYARPGDVWAKADLEAAGFKEYGRQSSPAHRPQCYCHGDRSETANRVVCKGPDCDGADCDPLFIEWLYALGEPGLEVYDAYATGRRGEPQGERGYRPALFLHRHVGRVPWDIDPARIEETMEALESSTEETV